MFSPFSPSFFATTPFSFVQRRGEGTIENLGCMITSERKGGKETARAGKSKEGIQSRGILFPSFLCLFCLFNNFSQEQTYPIYILVSLLVILFCVVRDSRGNDDMARYFSFLPLSLFFFSFLYFLSSHIYPSFLLQDANCLLDIILFDCKDFCYL